MNNNVIVLASGEDDDDHTVFQTDEDRKQLEKEIQDDETDETIPQQIEQ